jgi:hypothetical protein
VSLSLNARMRKPSCFKLANPLLSGLGSSRQSPEREGAMFNLFIACDLIAPGQNYDGVRDRIKELGQWHQFQLSLFYVSSARSPQQAYAHVAQAMDVGDRLAVIDAKQGVVSNWDHPPIDAINAIWIAP